MSAYASKTKKEIELRIAILLEQRKLSSGEQTKDINCELQLLRHYLSQNDSVQKSSAAVEVDAELESLLSSFTQLRVTAKSHRLRGSNATEEEKLKAEEDLNLAMDQLTEAKNKKKAHKAGYDAAKDSIIDAFVSKRHHDNIKTTGIVHDTTGIMGKHRNPHDKMHPECPGRLLSIMEAVRATGLYNYCLDIEGRKVTNEELLSVHPKEHLDEVERLRSKEHRDASKKQMANESVYANEHTTEAAYFSCGASMTMTECVLSGKVQNGLVVARPPGHHAEPCQCMGFCIFNNVAVAAANALKSENCNKVLIVDWDVHHGNGTQRMFYENEHVMYVSIHRYDDGSFYPPSKDGGPSMVGKGSGLGKNINIGWNSKRLSDTDYLAAFEYCIMPACRQFSPDLIYVSAGFDAARGDPLGGCDVTPSGYGQMLHQLTSLANGKVIVVLEGGYNLRSIAASAVACLNVLVGGKPPSLDEENGSSNSIPPPSKMAIKSITATIRAHKEIAKSHWAMHFPMLGGSVEEEEEEEELLSQPQKETAEQIGKKMRMRAMFESMRAKRAAAAQKKKQQQQSGGSSNGGGEQKEQKEGEYLQITEDTFKRPEERKEK